MVPMRLYRFGDEGEPVRDIQDRLLALGHDAASDAAGLFDTATERAVKSFQTARGLAVDGIVGPDTWRALVAAGYRLGDRMLYRRVPMMRGDDVAELQRRLNSLGFESGKVDGVFGSETLRAVLEFQSNRRLPEDGIAGREVALELDLMVRATRKPGRELVRERQWLLALPHHLVGQRVYVDPACRNDEEAAATWEAARFLATIIQDLGAIPVLSRSVDTHPPDRVRAGRANRLGVDFVVGFALASDGAPGVYHYASEHGVSTGGAALARAVASVTGLAAAGRATAILRETRSPAVVIASDEMDAALGGKVAQALINLFADQEQRVEPPVR
jgi:peptidoglycan hydrolase-like protein with peptidoglycan-binding domain